MHIYKLFNAILHCLNTSTIILVFQLDAIIPALKGYL